MEKCPSLRFQGGYQLMRLELAQSLCNGAILISGVRALPWIMSTGVAEEIHKLRRIHQSALIDALDHGTISLCQHHPILRFRDVKTRGADFTHLDRHPSLSYANQSSSSVGVFVGGGLSLFP